MTDKRVLLIAVAAAGLLAAAPAAAITYNPASEGPFAANFRYGYDAGSGFTAFSAGDFQTSGCPIATNACYLGPASFLGVYFAPADGVYNTANLRTSEITFHPGPAGQQAGLEFVAPAAGRYSFAGRFRHADSAGDGVIYTTPVASGLVTAPGGVVAFSFEQTLAAGGITRFLIGPNGSYLYDTTGLTLDVTLTAAVPEPAAWAMMIAGFGLVGAVARRRAHGAAALA